MTDRPKTLSLAQNAVRLLHDRMQKAEARGEHALAAQYREALREERAAVTLLFAVRIALPWRRAS